MKVFEHLHFTNHFAKRMTIFRPKKDEHRQQSTPEVVEAAILVKKYAGADSEVEKAECGAGRVDVEDFRRMEIY